jgi:type II secretory pathway component GspD/PulD (secretin)
MKFSTLRWFCALGSLCILALVKPPVSKRSAVAVSKATSAATVRHTSSTAVQPAVAGARFLVPEPGPLLDSVAFDGKPAATPRFLVPEPAPMPSPSLTPVAVSPRLLPVAFEPAPALPDALIEQFVPVVLSSAPPEPAPAAPAPFVPALQSAPAAQPENGVPVALGGPSSGLTGLPELSSDGYWIENAPLNEIFQYLARRAELQYFFNNELAGPEYTVTGHLKLTDSQKQMEDLATAYGLTVHQQGSTIYLMTEAQLAKLPIEVMCYPLKYLRGSQPVSFTSAGGSGGGGGGGGGEGDGGGGGGGGQSGAGAADFNKLLAIIKPLLTREHGHIEFEEKNNVLLVSDNALKLKKVRAILEEIDRPKQQIVINVRILRVRKGNGSKIGVDWSNMLGRGLPVSASQSLNAMFGLPDSATLTKTLQMTNNIGTSFSRSRDIITGGLLPSNQTTINDTFTRDTTNNSGLDRIREYTDGAGLVFDALQMEAIVHALKNNDLITQEACPTIITEDNEQGNVSFVDRFPIVTSTVVATTSGTNVTDEVRYKIDDEDPNAADDPQKSREIGVTLSVTPTLLPDGTVRMRLRPRVAKIVELIPGLSGNSFPRVSESTVEGISRIPQGRSLFLGGFYDSNDDFRSNKVPVLGSIPLINKLFSYRDKLNEQISLVFIITPQVYDAASAEALPAVNRQVQTYSGYNRVNPSGPVTPLLPDPRPDNGYLPVPVDRDFVPPPPGSEALPPTRERRSWFKFFNKKQPAAKEVIMEAPTPEPPQASRRNS